MASAAASSTRAGRFEAQPSGYRAFLPAPLPPQPPVTLAGDLPALLSTADRALGRLDGSVLTLPHPDLFVTAEEMAALLPGGWVVDTVGAPTGTQEFPEVGTCEITFAVLRAHRS